MNLAIKISLRLFAASTPCKAGGAGAGCLLAARLGLPGVPRRPPPEPSTCWQPPAPPWESPPARASRSRRRGALSGRSHRLRHAFGKRGIYPGTLNWCLSDLAAGTRCPRGVRECERRRGRAGRLRAGRGRAAAGLGTAPGAAFTVPRRPRAAHCGRSHAAPPRLGVPGRARRCPTFRCRPRALCFLADPSGRAVHRGFGSSDAGLARQRGSARRAPTWEAGLSQASPPIPSDRARDSALSTSPRLPPLPPERTPSGRRRGSAAEDGWAGAVGALRDSPCGVRRAFIGRGGR